MNETYLPGSARERILDLMKHQKVTQKDLAQRIDITESALSRFLSGATDRLDSEYLLRIAKCFSVSTDFLLGETAVPDRKNYEIVELGLSAQATRNLYTGRVCADVVNRLLESPRFAELTFLLQRYFTGELAQGYAAHNQMLSTLSSAVLSGAENENAAKQAAQEIKRSKLPTIDREAVFCNHADQWNSNTETTTAKKAATIVANFRVCQRSTSARSARSQTSRSRLLSRTQPDPMKWITRGNSPSVKAGAK